jgi:PAS domain S-box-containing protein
MMTRRKATVLIWILVGVFMALQTVVIRTLVLRGFSQTEHDEMVQNISRFGAYVDVAVGNLAGTASDWAVWDDTYRFASDKDFSFVAKNVNEETFTHLKINYMVLIDKSGNVKYGGAFDYDSGNWDTLPLALRSFAGEVNAHVARSQKQEPAGGIYMLDTLPVLVAWSPVLPSDGKGASAGVLLFGRSLVKSALHDLSMVTSLNVSLYGFRENKVPPAYQEQLSRGKATDSVFVCKINKDTIAAFTTVRDIVNRQPALVVKVTSARTTYRQGWFAVTLANSIVGLILVVVGFFALGLIRLARSAEKRLQERERYLQTVLHDAHLGVLAVDPVQGIVIEVNPGACVMLCRAREEMIGKPRSGFFEALPRAAEAQNDTSQACAGSSEQTMRTADGALVPVMVTVSFAEREGKRVRLETFMDISEQKKAEDAILRAEKLESLGILAGGIAHDFNNLLTGIYGFLNLASIKLKQSLDISDELSEASNTLKRARSLTQQLLTFAKGGSPVRTPVVLERLVKEAVPFALSGSPVTAVFSLKPDVWVCNADENLLAQVIDNLVINARQAMQKGGTLEIAAENVPDGADLPLALTRGAYVKVTVRDEGSGISPDNLPKVFDPFFTTKKSGSGLGLATAHSIMVKHGGHISLESVQGKGTTVTLFIPALAGVRPVHEEETERSQPGHGTVLVVDDEEIICRSCEGMLKLMGYSVFIARNDHEAVDTVRGRLAAGQPVSVAILDLTMKSSLGGVEILSQLRDIDPMIICIVSSGYSEDPVLSDPARYRFQGVLRKPYTYGDLEKVVRAAFALYESNVRPQRTQNE